MVCQPCGGDHVVVPGPLPGSSDRQEGVQRVAPDLTPPHFFLWGHLKFQVCKNCPKTIAELKKAMELAVRRIPVATCRAAMEAARDWAELCLRQNGSHLEDVLQMGD